MEPCFRGRVVPIVDLRKRLNLRENEQTKESRVVVDIAGRDVGVIVGAVTEVLRIPLSSVEPPSTMITNADSDYLRGIARHEDLRESHRVSQRQACRLVMMGRSSYQ